MTEHKVRAKVYEDTAGEFRWTATAANGETVADSGEGYETAYGAMQALRDFGSPEWEIDE